MYRYGTHVCLTAVNEQDNTVDKSFEFCVQANKWRVLPMCDYACL